MPFRFLRKENQMSRIKKDAFIKIFYNDIASLTNLLLAENLIENGPMFNHSRAMDWIDDASYAEKCRMLEKMGYNLSTLNA